MKKPTTMKIRKNYHPIYCPHLENKKCVSTGVVYCFDKLLRKHSVDCRRCPEHRRLQMGGLK